MRKKGNGIILTTRLLIWASYFFAGFILYSTKGSLNSFLISFYNFNHFISFKKNIIYSYFFFTNNFPIVFQK